jgi:hypothetical protein
MALKIVNLSDSLTIKGTTYDPGWAGNLVGNVHTHTNADILLQDLITISDAMSCLLMPLSDYDWAANNHKQWNPNVDPFRGGRTVF